MKGMFKDAKAFGIGVAVVAVGMLAYRWINKATNLEQKLPVPGSNMKKVA